MHCYNFYIKIFLRNINFQTNSSPGLKFQFFKIRGEKDISKYSQKRKETRKILWKSTSQSSLDQKEPRPID